MQYKTSKFNMNTTEDISNLLYGKIPPSSIGLEKAILGNIITEQNAYNKISDILKPETFYKNSHATIFRCIQDLFRNQNLLIY